MKNKDNKNKKGILAVNNNDKLIADFMVCVGYNLMTPKVSGYSLLKYQYRVNIINQPNFPTETYLFKSLFGIVHFQIPLN